MHPPRPISTNADTPCHAVMNSSIANSSLPNQEAEPIRVENHAVGLAGLNGIRRNNRTILNFIAHHVGANVSNAIMQVELDNRPTHVAGPSHTSQQTDTPNTGEITARTIQKYFRTNRIPHRYLTSTTIEQRLATANLTAKTFMLAMKIARTPNHPTLVAFGVNDHERETLVSYMSDLMNFRTGFNPITRHAGRYANNNPNNFISRIISQLRS